MSFAGRPSCAQSARIWKPCAGNRFAPLAVDLNARSGVPRRSRRAKMSLSRAAFGAPDPTRGPGLNCLQEYTMNMTEMHTKHRLERYGAVALRNAQGSTVTSVSGTLWLTMEGDSRDIVLDPGASFVVERDGLTIVAAHQASVVDFARPQPTRGWLERCADFVDRTWGPGAVRPSRNWVY